MGNFQVASFSRIFFLTEIRINWDCWPGNIPKYFYMHCCPDFCGLPPDFSFGIIQKTWKWVFALWVFF